LALDIGAQWVARESTQAFWAPVSLRARADGSQAVFPHFVMDRAKPGVIAVNLAGQRFVNEAVAYHRFALAMQLTHANSPSIPAYLVCDATALQRYGLGLVRPGGKGLGPFLADGYLLRGNSLEELAATLQVPTAAFVQTVERFNALARSGHDTDFGRGSSAYENNLGDAALGLPNPNLGPLTTAPFYALRLYPGDIGACAGLATDPHARVLREGGQPLQGLYAVGNDMQSIMGDVYPAPGITIGPGLVFAYLAIRHALSQT
jgi:succinate dehydrogenase/fumarate reductase flavoprotein subunit